MNGHANEGTKTFRCRSLVQACIGNLKNCCSLIDKVQKTDLTDMQFCTWQLRNTAGRTHARRHVAQHMLPSGEW